MKIELLSLAELDEADLIIDTEAQPPDDPGFYLNEPERELLHQAIAALRAMSLAASEGAGTDD